MPTSELIESFAQFARAQVNARVDAVLIDEQFDEWRILNPPLDDWLAIQASLRDMEHGETERAVEDFAAAFREGEFRESEC